MINILTIQSSPTRTSRAINERDASFLSQSSFKVIFTISIIIIIIHAAKRTRTQSLQTRSARIVAIQF